MTDGELLHLLQTSFGPISVFPPADPLADAILEAHLKLALFLIRRSSFCAGLDGLGQRMNSMKAFLLLQIRGLSAKQDECAAAQAEMKGQLDSVANDVEHTRNEVSEVRISSGLYHVLPRSQILSSSSLEFG